MYFAAQAETSFGTYAVPDTSTRPNADLKVVRTMSLVELVNVPETFVSSNPFYVNNQVKQIKPFLLLVQVQPDPVPAVAAGSVGAVQPAAAQTAHMSSAASYASGNAQNEAVVKTGRIFKHDPALAMQPTWFGQPLEVVSRDLCILDLA